MIIALAFASCGSKKEIVYVQQPVQSQQPTQQQPQQPAQQKDQIAQQPQVPVEIDMEIPCYEASRSDENYFREYGVYSHVNQHKAREKAIDNANEMMNRRLSRVVSGVKDEYTRTISKNEVEELEGVIEQAYHNVIFGALQTADNPCESKKWDPNGNKYVFYYTIEISKKGFGEKLQNELSKDDKYGVLFDQQNFFNKYANVLGGDKSVRE